MKNVNTFEEYRNSDKNGLLNQAGKTVSTMDPTPTATGLM